ncbi:protein phosphatase 2C domain-containing protein [Streptomyces sp. DT225]
MTGMSQQGGRPTGHEDDWWGQLYDDSTGDTGPAPAPDSLDDRFASAAGTVGGPEETGPAAGRLDPPDDRPGQPAQAERWGPSRPAGAERPGQQPPHGSRSGPSRSGETEGPGSPWPSDAERTGAPRASDAERSGPRRPGGVEPVVPAPRSGADDLPRPGGRAPQRAPWEPPPARATGPVTFPTASRPAGRAEPGDPAGPSSPSATDRPDSPAPAVPDAPPPPVSPPVPPPPPTVPPGWRDLDPSAAADPPRDATPPTVVGRLAPPAPADPPAVPPGPPPAVPPAVPAPPPEPPAGAGAPPSPRAAEAGPGPRVEPHESVPRARGHVGSRPPTYDAEPTALPPADPDDLGGLVADTVLDGARYGVCTVRAASVRGDSARYRGEPRRDALLTARFGTGEHALLLVAVATGARTAPGAHRAAAEACQWIGRAVGRSHARLVEDIRGGRRGDLKSGLHRLTDRSLGKLRASAAEQGVAPEEYAAGLRCLLLPADPECRTRVFFGVGPGGLFRLREGEWQDIEPQVTEARGEPVVGYGSPPSETPQGDRLTMDLGIPTPPSPYEPAPEPPREPFRFRTSVARPGDTLLMCSSGLAEPLRGEPELGEFLAERWSRPEPPGLAAFLADSQVRVKGYADDRTAAAVWEA